MHRDSLKVDRMRRWFHLGAAALGSVHPQLAKLYGCPLCLRACPIEALGYLTFEHVPPRSLGGTPVVLTCRSCNNTAGHLLDADARSFEDVVDFAAGTIDSPIRGYLAHEDVRIDMEFTASEQTVEIAGVAQTNAPGAVDAMTQRLDRMVEAALVGAEFSLTFRKGYRPRNASISWLRSAYLIAFAALGYRYILNPALAIVRQQIANPKETHIRCFSTLLPGADPATRIISFVERPVELVSVLVQMGRHIVLLPHPDDPLIYERLQRPIRASAKGLRLPWPNEPVFVLDGGGD
jgi:hypothetical protein